MSIIKKKPARIVLLSHFFIITSFALAAAIVGATLFFLYSSVWRALTQTETILTLREGAVIEPVDTNTIEKLELFLNRRKNLPAINPESLKNPFLKTAAKPLPSSGE